MNNKLEFQNITQDEIDKLFDFTGSDETHGEWYYNNITHFGTTNFDAIRNGGHHGLDAQDILSKIENNLSQQAIEHYLDKMAIYSDDGVLKTGLIEAVRLITGNKVGVGKNSRDYAERMNAELWFSISGKEHHCIDGVYMIDHAIPMDDPEDRCFESFSHAVQTLTELNTKENNG